MKVDNYQTDRQLSRGKETEVYEGLDRRTKRRVALKILFGRSGDRDAHIRRLTALQANLGQLNEAGLVVPLHCGPYREGGIFLVTPLIPGESLDRRLGHGALPEALRFATMIALTLAGAESRGLWHQALAPDKILLTTSSGGKGSSEQPVLLDVGVAQALRWTLDASQVSEPRRRYLAPEQRGELATAPDCQVDVYALAVLLFQMLGGDDPGRGSINELWRQLAQAGTGLSSSRLIAVCRMLAPMLVTDPARRPHMHEVAARLQQLVATERLPGEDEDVETVRFGKEVFSQIELARDLQDDREDSAHPAPAKAAAIDPLVGQHFGKYRLLKPIGAGGMGTVYEAEDEQIGYRAAVKVLHQDLARDPEYAKRFLNEARAVNIIRDAGLVTIFAFDQRADGSLYIVMEYLSGETLLDRLQRTGKPISEALAREVALQVARSLSIAHEKGIVHRDLKPANLMIIDDPVRPGWERIKVLDFGIAKLREPNRQDHSHGATPIKQRWVGLGTPGYMAPEQIGNADVDGQADVFSLGVVLYEGLTGQSLFTESALELLKGKPPLLHTRNPAVSAAFAKLVARMLDPVAKTRPTMRELVATLAPPGASAQSRFTPQQRRGVVALAGLLILSTIALAWKFWPSADPAPTPAKLAGLRQQAVNTLLAGLTAEQPELRAQAVKALGQTRDAEHQARIERLLEDSDITVRSAAAAALGQLSALEAQHSLIKVTDSITSDEVHLAAAESLLRLGVPRGREILRKAVAHASNNLRLQAAVLLLDHQDQTGAALVRAVVDNSQIPLEQRVPLMSVLAQVGDSAARQRLVDLLGQPTIAIVRIVVASSLAALGDESARRVLAETAHHSSPQRLLAAVLLASYGDISEFDLFRSVAFERGQPLDSRLLAIRGLTACGLYKGALALASLLGTPAEAPALRLAAAEAILQIVGSNANHSAEQNLRMAQAMLGSADQRLRLDAVSALGELESEQALVLLGEALKDSSTGVRIAATQALSHKRVRATLSRLRLALDDADSDVREAGLQAIGQVLIQLDGQGDKSAVTEVHDRLVELVRSGDPASQVIAGAVLVRSGDTGQLNILLAGLRSASPLVRKLVVELSQSTSELVQTALADSDPLVRFAAACKLAESGSRSSIAVLREALARGGVDGLLAYGLLLRLKEKVTPPVGLDSVLAHRDDLPARLAVLDVLQNLPIDEALRLLRLARVDSAWEVRRKVIGVATDFYRKTQQPRWLDFVRGLVNDPTLAVRARAVSTLLLLTGDFARPTFDPPPAQPQTKPEVTLPAGPTLPVKEKPATPIVAPVVRQPQKESLEQVLSQAAALIGRGQFRRAQPLLDRIRAQRNLLRPNQRAELAFQQGRCYEAQGLSQQAAEAYREYLTFPAALRKAEQLRLVNQALQTMNSKLGTLLIFGEQGGKCKISEQHLAPGDYKVPGSNQQVRIRAGATTSVGACR